MPKRQYEIHDLYVMALAFILSYSVTRIIKSVVEKRKHRNYKNVPNPNGGSIEINDVIMSDDSELSLAILACIANEHSYKN